MTSCAAHPDRSSTALCSRCERTLCDDCTQDLTGQPYCANCVSALEQKLTEIESGAGLGATAAPFEQTVAAPGFPVGDLAVQNVSLAKPVLFALAAGLAGSVAWYLSVVVSDYKLGLVAIGVGWLVGWAAVRGAGGHGSKGLGLASVVVALAAMLFGEYLIINHSALAYLAQENPGTELPRLIGWSPFLSIYRESLGAMDAVFYAIGAWEAWKQPATARA